MRSIAARAAIIFAFLASTGVACAHPVASDYLQTSIYRSLQAPSSAQERAATPLAPDPNRLVYTIAPADTDPAITHYLKDNYVMFERQVSPNAELFLFLPGTYGRPAGVQNVLSTAAKNGYRAIGLMYDDIPAIGEACSTDPDPTCSARFRETRIYGDHASSDVPDAPAESIVPRLVALLRYLAAYHPGEGWGGYLVDGQPNWSRIVVSGHSQGAGMAAVIAKQHLVARVALISSPFDFYGSSTQQLAAWISAPGGTPADRWYGIYHQRETFASTIARAYVALGLPPSHVRVVDADPRIHLSLGNIDAYHISIASDLYTPLDPDGAPVYAGTWSFIFGTSP